MAIQGSEHHDEIRITPVVRWLVIGWLAAALVQATIVTPADLREWLGFSAAQVGHAWWTVGTYALIHGGTWPLVVSLLVVLIFGPRLEHLWGTRAFAAFFLWCVAGGALSHALFIHAGVLEGPAAGLFGVMLAYAWLWPKDELFLFGVLPVRVWTLVTIATVLMLSLGVSTGSGWGYLAQLGGFAFAALYLKRPNPASIDELRHRMSPAPDPTDETPRAIPRTMPRTRRGEEVDEIVAQSKAAVAKHPARTARGSTPRDARRDALNRVLDKISEQGLDSLTAEDRTLLEEMSRRLRDR